MTFIPVRRGDGVLHIAAPTGRGYTTACGRKLAGADLSIPMPRIDLGRRHREYYWADVFAADGCAQCTRKNPAP